MDLIRLKNSKKANKGYLTRIINTIATKVAETPTTTRDEEIKQLIETLNHRWGKFADICEKIQDEVPSDNLATMEAEITELGDVENEFRASRAAAESARAEWAAQQAALQQQSQQHQQDKQHQAMMQVLDQQDKQQRLLEQQLQLLNTNQQQRAQSTKLPKIELQTFSGNILEWPSFWEGFQAAVDSKTDLKAVEKFNYLKGYLTGEPRMAIEGLALNSNNYRAAVDLLEQQYGNDKAIIESHLHQLDSLVPVKDVNNITGLKRLRLSVQANINALEALGVSKQTFGVLFGTRLLKAIPSEYQKEWSKSSANDITDLPALLKFIQEQIEASERLNRLRGGQTRQKSAQPPEQSGPCPPTASALTTTTSKTSKKPASQKSPQTRKCIFCPETHRLTKCPVSVKKKLEVVNKEKRCLRCLDSRHITKDCVKAWTCRICGNEHHTAICTRTEGTPTSEPSVSVCALQGSSQPKLSTSNDQSPNSSTLSACATIFGTIFLKTATVMVHGPGGSKEAIALVDDASERTFIKKSLVDEIKPAISGKESLAVGSFGQEEPGPESKKSRYSITIQGGFAGAKPIKLLALEVPFICAAKAYQKTEFATELLNAGHILADDRLLSGSTEAGEVDILIGADQLHKICIPETITSRSGLVATNSKLGWLLLGPTRSAPDSSQNDQQRVVTMLTTIAEKTNFSLEHKGHSQQEDFLCQQTKDERKNTSQSLVTLQEENSEKQEATNQEFSENWTDEFDLSFFWTLEHMGILDKDSIVEDELKTKLKNYEDEIRRNPETQRYIAPYPWKVERSELSTNFNMAASRATSLLKRLKKTPGLLETYDAEINKLIEDGFVVEVDLNYDGPHTYLPHRPVIRQDKKTSKVRPVFDGSARSQDGPSLNNCLEAGPNLNPDLIDVLLGWTAFEFAWIADLEQAFLNMELTPEDAEAIRFLWFHDPKQENPKIKALSWLRVPFGLSSSPFLLRTVISKHLKLFKDKYPLTVKQIEKQLYVDDYLGGTNKLSTAKNMVRQTIEIFADAKLKMRKWITNDPDLRQLLEHDGLASPVNGVLSKTLTEEDFPKVLGLRWDTNTDCFKFDPTPIIAAAKEIGDQPTKRKILQISARIFDPLGFLSPTVLLLKIIFQKLWERELDWDDSVPPELKTTWESAVAGLCDLSLLKIPRWLGTGDPDLKQPIELHIFGDASEAAYGTVAYVRLKLPNGNTKIKLVCSKTRVAPLPKKKVTLPRLELLAALLGSRLADTIVKALNGYVWTVIFWSDSLVSLGWIRGDRHRWKPFVRNQVDKIRKNSDLSQWRHCPGTDNPADLASRGAPAAALVQSDLWWNGPTWLKYDQAKWPAHITFCDDDIRAEINLESKKPQVIVTAAIAHLNVEWELTRINKYIRLIRVHCWMLRLIRNLKRIRTQPDPDARKVDIRVGRRLMTVDCLTGNELREAELLIFRQIQRDRYPNIVASLSEGLPLPKQQLSDLRPRWDSRDKLIRVTGRVELALQEQASDPPILLPADHPVVGLLITAIHQRNHHTGVRTTLSELRNKFWIIRGRQQVKKILRTCVSCLRMHSRPFDEIPAALPLARVREARPFEVCGVDFAGPFLVKLHKLPITTTTEANEDPIVTTPDPVATPPRMEKAYVCLFTCATTRAIHLELVRDMTAAKFILAIRKFFALRGMSSIIYSDNAQTFSCADKYLKLIRADPVVGDWLANNQIEWRFSACLAPWWGGFWERMVRTSKELFRKSYGRASLEFDELQTAMAEIEHVINSRPLTYVAEGTDDPVALTPNQLLIGPSTNRDGPPPETMEGSADAHALTKRDRDRRAFVLTWWRRWQREYLGELSRFHAKGKAKRSPRLGELVTIHDANEKRLYWQTGVVKELIPGRDGKVRSVMVKIPSGKLLSRAIQCLYPLEIYGDVPDEDVAGSDEEDATVVVPTELDSEFEPPPDGSPGEDVGNNRPPVFTRRGRAVNVPRRFHD